MKQKRASLTKLIPALALLTTLICTIVPIHAQNEGSPTTEVSALEWAHREYDRTLPIFDTIPRIKDRLYIITGSSIADGWRSELTTRIGFKIGAGFRLTPIHAVESHYTHYYARNQGGGGFSKF